MESCGPSLNLIKDPEYCTNQIKLNKDDQVILYTDGVVEVFDKGKNQFGLDRLTKLIRSNLDKSPKEMIDIVIQSTKEFSFSGVYKDDFTLLALKKTE